MSELPDANALGTKVGQANDDSALLALERQFNAIAADLFAAHDELTSRSAPQLCDQRADETLVQDNEEAGTRRVEAILARLSPYRTGDHADARMHDRWLGREGPPRGLRDVPILRGAYQWDRLGCTGGASPY